MMHRTRFVPNALRVAFFPRQQYNVQTPFLLRVTVLRVGSFDSNEQ